MFPKLGFCEVGETLPIKGILEMFEAQREVEYLRVIEVRFSRDEWSATIGRSEPTCRGVKLQLGLTSCLMG